MQGFQKHMETVSKALTDFFHWLIYTMFILRPLYRSMDYTCINLQSVQ